MCGAGRLSQQKLAIQQPIGQQRMRWTSLYSFHLPNADVMPPRYCGDFVRGCGVNGRLASMTCCASFFSVEA